jgi:non-ribosomal peptide synthetase-like protein
MGILPVLAKWLLIGRWKPRRIRAWGLAYFRFWLVKTMIVANPLARLFVGTPLYVLYLRALGARIGRRVVIFTQHVPVCADLLTIGAGSVIRKDTYLSGYRARAGAIETGAVTIGAGVFVGEHAVLDIGTALGDGAQLGHASALLTGQAVPAGESWHGSPAEPAGPGDDYRTVGPARCGALRRAGYSLMRLLLVLAVAGPAAAAVISLLVSRPPLLAGALSRVDTAGWAGPLSRAGTAGWALPVAVLAVSAAAFLGAILAGLVIAGTVPRLLSRALAPGKVYPLYGIHYALQRAISRLSNVGFFNALFGDSSAIVRYLGLIGYRLAPVEQTGSNFGMEVKHEMPTLAAVGTGTMVSDGLSIINADFSSSSFRVCPAVIGTRNFLGNGIAYPAGGRTGDDCLLATKVMIPVSGPVREGVGLLGSPSFEIPRSVHSDQQFGHLSTNRRRRHRLKAKNRHNAATIGLHLLVRWLYFAGLALIALYAFGGTAVPGASRTGRVGAAVAGALRTAVAAALRTVSGLLRPTGLRTAGLGTTGLGTAMHDALRTTVLGTTVGDALRTAAAILLALAFTVGYFVLVERAVTGFRALKPRFCSIYQPLFWRHERFWKVPSIAYIQMFSGTPSRTSSGACWVSGSAVASSMTAARSWSGPWSGSAVRPPSTRGASCRAIPWKTAPSSPVTSPSAPGPPWAPAPSSTTPWTWATAPCSARRLLPHEGRARPAGLVVARQPRRRGTGPAGPARYGHRSARRRRGRGVFTGQHVAAAPAPAPAPARAFCPPVSTPLTGPRP